LHEANVAFGYYLANRETIPAITHGYLGNKSQVRIHQALGSFRIFVLLVPLGEHVLLLRLKHWKLADLIKVAAKSAFPCSECR
jgi:hypothetical protein